MERRESERKKKEPNSGKQDLARGAIGQGLITSKKTGVGRITTHRAPENALGVVGSCEKIMSLGDRAKTLGRKKPVGRGGSWETVLKYLFPR